MFFFVFKKSHSAIFVSVCKENIVFIKVIRNVMKLISLLNESRLHDFFPLDTMKQENWS